MATETTEIISSDQIKNILANDSTVILDVRGPEEILETGYLKTKRSDGKYHQWIQLACTRTEAPLLEMTMSALIGDDKDRPILVYCKSGKRAELAKLVLEKGGYTHVYNAGGWDDVKSFVVVEE